MNPSLRKDLIAMMRRDSRVRTQLAKSGELYGGYHPEMERIHLANARRLEQILVGYGWPGESIVGEDGCEAAWIILQHAISRPELQRKGCKLLTDAVAAGEAPGAYLARLTDRIRFFEGRKQVYGTNFDWDSDGKMSPTPIENPDDVDSRRKALGLPPLSADIDRMRQDVAGSDEAPPENLDQRREKFVKWCQEVGWR